jgi:hypothetical protein
MPYLPTTWTYIYWSWYLVFYTAKSKGRRQILNKILFKLSCRKVFDMFIVRFVYAIRQNKFSTFLLAFIHAICQKSFQMFMYILFMLFHRKFPHNFIYVLYTCVYTNRLYWTDHSNLDRNYCYRLNLDR